MRRDLLITGGALLAALLIVTPAVDSVSGGILNVADELSRGTFRPFGQGFGDGDGGDGGLGGISGNSPGNYVPGEHALPNGWAMDRNADAGTVTIDLVLDPALGGMKRLKAFDTFGPAPTYRMGVSDTDLDPAVERAGVDYDWTFRGSFDVRFRPGVATPIFAPGPDAVVTSYETTPGIPGEVAFLRDSADTLYARVDDYSGKVRLNVTYATPSAYHSGPDFRGHVGFDEYPDEMRPDVPEAARDGAAFVLDRANVRDRGDVVHVAHALQQYFLDFGESGIPSASEYPDTYLALALGENGCCRHRAFAYALTMQALGAPARVVVNEAHAFAEVQLPGGAWWQVNLGGCGTYEVNNPDGNRPLGDLGDPGSYEARNQPPEATTVADTQVVIQGYTDPLEKGAPAYVAGFVHAPDVAPVEGLPVDVHLNATREVRGRIVGTGVTNAEGQFRVPLRLPDDVRAGAHELNVHAMERQMGRVLWEPAWSLPSPVGVTSATHLAVDAPDLEGQGAPFTVDVTLTDNAGEPLRGERVSLDREDTRLDDAVTDADGVATFRVTLDRHGTYDLWAVFDETPYLHASRASARVTVGAQGIDVAPAFDAVTGGNASVNGTTLEGGTPAAGRSVGVRVVDANGTTWHEETVRADGDGRFTSRFPVPTNATAQTLTAHLDLTGSRYEKRVPILVRGEPTLAVDAAAAYTETGWPVTACLTDRAGTAVPGAELGVRFRGGDVDVWQDTVTTVDGCATVTLPAASFDAGPLTATVAFNGTDAYAPVNGKASAHAIAGAPPAPPLPAWVLATLAAGVGLVVVGGSVLLSRRGVTPRRVARGAALALRLKRETRVHLAFPGLEPDVPDVWAADAPVPARVTVLERASRRAGAAWQPVADARVRVRVDTASEEKVTTDANGTATVHVPVAGKGTARVTARYRGSLTRAGAEDARDVRAVEYREEVERGYRALVSDAMAAGAPVTAASTPRDVERRLATWTRDDVHADLATVAARFEALAFSEQAVTRADYVTFARATKRVRAAFPSGREVTARA